MDKLIYFLILVAGSYFVTTMMKGATLKEPAVYQTYEILGTWTEADNSVPYRNVGTLKLTSRKITFNEDGTYTYSDKVKFIKNENASNPPNFTRQSSGKWKLKENILLTYPIERVVNPNIRSEENLRLAREWSVSSQNKNFEEEILQMDMTKMETWSKEYKEKRLYLRYSN